MTPATALQRLIENNPDAEWAKHADWVLKRLGEAWVILVELPPAPHTHEGGGACWPCRRREWLEKMK